MVRLRFAYISRFHCNKSQTETVIVGTPLVDIYTYSLSYRGMHLPLTLCNNNLLDRANLY